MAVLIEAVSVVVRNRTLAAKYPGGVAGFRRDCPNNTFVTDGHLCRIGFMLETDADYFVAESAARGLMPRRRGVAEDIALVSSVKGPLLPTPWLEFDRTGDRACAWLAGDERSATAEPEGGADRSIRQMSAKEVEQLEFVRTDGSVDVYRDESGKELYVGRTGPARKLDMDRHSELYNKAWELIKDKIQVGHQPLPAPDPATRRALDEATSLYEEVVRINPANWAAMWMMGKICQRLGDCETGFRWFSRAHRLNPEQADVAREASIAAMEIGRPEEAIPLCEAGIEAKPDDAGLQANLALALLFAQRPKEALAKAEQSLARDPADEITGTLVRIMREVVSGTRPCPHHARDLQ